MVITRYNDEIVEVLFEEEGQSIAKATKLPLSPNQINRFGYFENLKEGEIREVEVRQIYIDHPDFKNEPYFWFNTGTGRIENNGGQVDHHEFQEHFLEHVLETDRDFVLEFLS